MNIVGVEVAVWNCKTGTPVFNRVGHIDWQDSPRTLSVTWSMIYFGSTLRYLFTTMYTLLVNYLDFQQNHFIFGFVWLCLATASFSCPNWGTRQSSWNVSGSSRPRWCLSDCSVILLCIFITVCHITNRRTQSNRLTVEHVHSFFQVSAQLWV